MIGKRVQFDDETWAAIEAVANESGRSFQEVADEAFADFLKKHKQPVGLRAALKESVAEKPRKKRKR
jgi:predicted transcriptional regulator